MTIKYGVSWSGRRHILNPAYYETGLCGASVYSFAAKYLPNHVRDILNGKVDAPLCKKCERAHAKAHPTTTEDVQSVVNAIRDLS